MRIDGNRRTSENATCLQTLRVLWATAIALVLLAVRSAAAQSPLSDAAKQDEQQRTEAYAAALEHHLQAWLVNDYAARAADAWNRNYESEEAFLESVQPNRTRWRRLSSRRG